MINSIYPGVSICNRGVIYTTDVCQIKCHFCYYKFNKPRPNPKIEDLKKIAYIQRTMYGLDATDLTGFGEPTLYPNINELVKYCAEIGLKPTLITNAQRTDKIVELIKDCGLQDILMSVHGIGEIYDEIVGVPGAWLKMAATMEELKKLNFSFRTNCVITKLNVDHLIDPVTYAYSKRARHTAFILFNPHEGTDWKDKNAAFSVKYTEAAPKIQEAIEHMRKLDLKYWINARYIPLCAMKGYEQHVTGFHQWLFDPYEWEECSGNNIYPKFTSEFEYIHFIKQKTARNIKPSQCAACMNRLICDGIHPAYAKQHGTDEFKETEGDTLTHPMHYRKDFVEDYSR